MNDKISFSFVMPAFKKQFLYRAIDSIIKQSYPNFELIIVNDASPEDLISIVSQFHDTRIQYKVNKENIGGRNLVANWNHCVKQANKEYIILATDDDFFEPNFLQNAVKLIEKYPNVDLIRSGVKKINEKGQILDMEFPMKEYLTAREFTLIYAKGGIISCISNYIFKKTALNQNNGFISFPHAHYSDDATALALSHKGVACIPTNEFSFRVSSINLSNQSSYILAIEQIKASEQYMKWYMKHVAVLDTKPGDFFEHACYGGYKQRYITMIEKLTDKIPLRKFYLAIKVIFSTTELFNKERLKLTIGYLINKL